MDINPSKIRLTGPRAQAGELRALKMYLIITPGSWIRECFKYLHTPTIAALGSAGQEKAKYQNSSRGETSDQY